MTSSLAVRASHNPPNPAMLSLADRLGVMFLDENRVFAVGDQYTQNMKDLVSRDRNHPSGKLYIYNISLNPRREQISVPSLLLVIQLHLEKY